MKILKIVFILWLLTLGIHLHHEKSHRNFIFISASNSAVELRPTAYAHDYYYKDHQFFFGIPYVGTYSGEAQPLPASLRLTFHASDNLIGAEVHVENVYVHYHDSDSLEKIQCEKPSSNDSIKEKAFNAGHTGATPRITYEAKINVLDCIPRREDFNLTTEGYILHEGEKINFEFINQAHYLKSLSYWSTGWRSVYTYIFTNV